MTRLLEWLYEALGRLLGRPCCVTQGCDGYMKGNVCRKCGVEDS